MNCSRSRPFPPCGVASVADAWPCCRSENYIPSQLTSRQSERGPRCRQIFPTARPQPPRLERLRLRYSWCRDRKSAVKGKGGSGRVDLGGRRIINKKINESITVHNK